MHKKCLAVVLMFILLGAAGGFGSACAEEEERRTESMDTLMSTVSPNVAAIREEAEQLGIAPAERKRYITRMRSINRKYQHGSLTRTEYIALKRRLIKDLRK